MKRIHYSWFIVLISACVFATYALTTYSFGVFLKPLTVEFNWDRGALSGAFALHTLLAGLLAFLSGRLCDRYGPRLLITLSSLLNGAAFLLMSQIHSLWQVYLLWGLLVGIGGGCCPVPLMSTIPRWFAQKKGMAVGIILAGFGLGAIITPLLAQWLISTYGWRQSFIILGLIILVIMIPLAQFMKHSPERIGLKPYGESVTIQDKQPPALTTGGLSFKQAIKTGRFWMFGSVQLCYFFCLNVILVHIVPHAIDVGTSAVVAASILSVIAGGSIIGRLSMGFISDRIGARLALSACTIQLTLALIWLLFAREIWMLYIFGVVFGFAYGGVSPLLPLVPAELFGLKSLGVITGSLWFLATFGAVPGAPLAGSVFDITGGYTFAFLACIVVGTLAVILSQILFRYKGAIPAALNRSS